MPWQKHKIRGENSGRHCKKWLRYDPIHWDAPGPVMCGRWFTFGPPKEEFASWAEVIRDYGDWTLVPTSNKASADGGWKSPGWDEKTDPPGAPASTATGTCLNFVIGARKEFAAVYGSDTVRWANDYRGFQGYVDWFTLGIDGKHITYNFEPAADASPPKITELTAKAAAALKPGKGDSGQAHGHRGGSHERDVRLGRRVRDDHPGLSVSGHQDDGKPGPRRGTLVGPGPARARAVSARGHAAPPVDLPRPHDETQTLTVRLNYANCKSAGAQWNVPRKKQI